VVQTLAGVAARTRMGGGGRRQTDDVAGDRRRHANRPYSAFPAAPTIRVDEEAPDMDKLHNPNPNPNREFELGGINHVALVGADMARTVDFYSGVFGMLLIKSLDLPDGMGQHFFFDEYRKRLIGKGVNVGPVLNHDESLHQVAAKLHPKEFGAADIPATPKTSADRELRHPVAH